MNVIDYITITCNKKKIWLQITSDYMKKCNRLQLITTTITITPCLNCHPQLFKVGRVIVPCSFSHEVVLVKFELQTHMEHLSSCRSGVLVVFGLLNLQFSVLLIRNFLSAIKYLSFCFVITVYLYHILLMK